MPYKKNYKKKPFRKYKKKWTGRKSTAMTTTPSLPIGKKFTFKTRYVVLDGLLQPGAAPVTHVYSMNGLYDPSITGLGHQPIGFDQLMPMYDNYTVIGSRARVTFSNESATKSAICTLQLKDNAASSVLTDDVLENGNSQFAVLGAATGNAVKTLVAPCNVSKFLGRKVLQDDDCRGHINANPLEQVYLHVTAKTYDALATTIRYSIVIEYVAILTEPVQLIGS